MTPDPEEDEFDAPDASETKAVDDLDVLRSKAAERDEYLDRLQRTMAEFQNYRNRVNREKSDLRKFVTSEVIRAILPSLDNLERALAASENPEDDPLFAGVRMVVDQMHRALDGLGVKPIQTKGAKFDPSQMDAVVKIETADAEENTVLEVFEKGWRLDDFVIRPARVGVAAAVKQE
jgi:molecular chaperone GrpE